MAEDQSSGERTQSGADAALAATREILAAISEHRSDEKQVFDVILENACKLCNAQTAFVAALDDAETHLVIPAWRGASEAFADGLKEFRHAVTETHLTAVQAMVERRVIRIDDIADTDTYRQGEPVRVFMVDVENIRSLATVPLLSGDRGIGSILLYRREVDPFTDDDIALIEGFAEQAVIAIENARQFREVQRRLERERASADILEVISTSRDDEKPVFDVIVEAASRLCDAPLAYLCVLNEQRTHVSIPALTGARPEFAAALSRFNEPVESDWLFAVKSSVDCEVIRFDDLADSDLYRSGNEYRLKMVDEEGMRSVLSVPVEAGGVGYGCIVLYRREVAPFSDDDVELVRGFASQAVIAIENVRQFRELQNRLQREAATGEVLRVISISRDDDVPVFKTILENAQRLCGATNGAIVLGEDGGGPQVLAAQTGASEATLERYRKGGFAMDPTTSVAAKAIIDGETLYYPKITEGAPYKEGMEAVRMHVETEGLQTSLYVPLMLTGRGIGCINLLHKDQRSYRPDEITLIETFAAQAVIAIENVRQFREVQERLEREEATKEVLAVISQSRDDELPVFRAILERAERLCNANASGLQLVSEDRKTLNYALGSGEDKGSFTPGMTTWDLDGPYSMCLAVREARVVHIEDLEDSQLYRDGDPGRVALVDVEGVRTHLHVPLLKDGVAFGNMSLSRLEPKPFSADEIALIETFAAQAVIAIENVRQFRELQERLAREAATGEVLGVISTSRDDETPVFDAIIENASRLCKAPIAFLSVANEGRTEVIIPAHLGTRSEFGDILEDFREPITRTELVAIRPVATGETVMEDDIKDDDAYRNGDPRRLQMVDVEGARSVMAVPLIRKEVPIGAIVLYRREVAPFSTDDLSLVRSFAAQAVIAIENVRQFRELQQRLEREAATGEVLNVISTSRTDDRPVFDAILDNAARLCDAPVAALALTNKDRTHLRIAAYRGAQSDFLRSETEPWPLDAPIIVAKAVLDNEIIHVEDLADDNLYPGRHPVREIAVHEEGVRSFLVVPLVIDGVAIGAIGLYRREKRKFSASDVELVKTFASQASIAIENVSQFKALETLNAELGDRVESQVGEIERMGRLKRFLPSAVADAVVTSGDESMLTSHRAMVATLFCDMRGFTAFCEAAEPEETIEVLQTYHQEMSDLIDEYGGGVDQRAGDGIMVIFNDPIPVDDPAGDAVRLAVAMREKMRELCAKWKRLGHRLGFGVGISLGYATVGMVGSAGRFDYTASGTSVNTAARLCDMAADGEILISPRVWVAVEGDFQAESRGEVEMKGIREPVEVFAVG